MQQLSFLPGEMTPGERSLILRALKTLDRHLHEPGVAFTSTRAAREWLILNMAGLERGSFWAGSPQAYGYDLHSIQLPESVRFSTHTAFSKYCLLLYASLCRTPVFGILAQKQLAATVY